MRDLVGIFRHLDRGPDVEDLPPGVPACRDAEGLDRHRARCGPTSRVARQAMLGSRRNPSRPRPRRRCGRAARWSRAPDGPARRPCIGLLAVEHEGQRLVFDRDQLGGVLGERPAVRDHRRDPLARIARDVHGEGGRARHVRRVETRGQQRLVAPASSRRRARNARPAWRAPQTCRSRRCSRPDAGRSPAPRA